MTIISGRQSQDQNQQIEQAYENNDRKIVDELSEKIATLKEALGPEYLALVNGLRDIDPENDKLGAEIRSLFGALDALCTR